MPFDKSPPQAMETQNHKMVSIVGRPNVNKWDPGEPSRPATEFLRGGFANTLDTSAAHGRGIGELIEVINERLSLEKLARSEDEDKEQDKDKEGAGKGGKDEAIRLAIVG